MLQYLRDTNPARIWLREKFQISQELVGGQHIVVRFDLASTDFFTEDNVAELYCEQILGDRGMSSQQFNGIANSIAFVLNQKMQLEAEQIMRHVRLSLDVLAALSVHNYALAYYTLEALLKRLDMYGAHADKIWAPWCQVALDAIKSDNDPGFGLDVVI